MPAIPVQRAPSTLINQPFSWLPEAHQKGVLIGAILLTAVLMAAIVMTNAPLQSPAAPMGIVSLQLAGSLPAARAILASWGTGEQGWAKLNLGIDYLYLFAYATTLSLGCMLLARRFLANRCVAILGVGLSWGVVVAALLDTVENGFLLLLLLGNPLEAWAVLAYWCAVPKFALVLAALTYLVIGGLACLVERAVGKRRGRGNEPC